MIEMNCFRNMLTKRRRFEQLSVGCRNLANGMKEGFQSENSELCNFRCHAPVGKKSSRCQCDLKLLQWCLIMMIFVGFSESLIVGSVPAKSLMPAHHPH